MHATQPRTWPSTWSTTLSSALERGRESRLLRRVLPAPRPDADPCASAAITVAPAGPEPSARSADEGAPGGGPTPDGGPVTALRVSGELDMWTAPFLACELARLLGPRPGRVVLDLEDLCFCDVAGVRALLDEADRLAGRGGSLTVRNPCWSLALLLHREDREALLAR